MEPVIAEEFSVWKKNTPLLYDLVISHSLEWPSLTVEWLPSLPSTYAGDLSVHKLILGTHTSDDAPNFLMLADVHLPADPSSALVVDPEKSVLPKVDVVQKIQVDGEVNRARCMVQNQAIIAVKTLGSEVYVFDSNKEPETKSNSCEPDLRLRGYEKEGYGFILELFQRGLSSEWFP